MATKDAQFVGSVPDFYEKHLVPVIFEPFAEDLVKRIGPRDRGELLEVACGTGVVTRKLIPHLTGEARLTATDLNDGMLRIAQSSAPASGHVTWRVADGLALSFADQSFDTVFCQFGVMFYPDRMQGFREARRVLRTGGEFRFNVWDTFERNPFGRISHETIARFFPVDTPTFYLTPFGFHDADLIDTMLRSVGFREIKVEHVAREGVARSALDFATGLIRGNPVRAAERGVDEGALIEALASELAKAGGDRPNRLPMQAVMVRAIR